MAPALAPTIAPDRAPVNHAQSSDHALRSDSNDALRLAPELAALIPGGCLRPGGTVEVSAGVGHLSVLLRLLSEPTARGAWAAVIGLPSINAHAAVECGVAIERLALIPDPGTSWLDVTAALLDAVDLVVLNPPHECRPSDARRLLARARQRRSVLILIDGGGNRGPRNRPPRRLWPEPADILFTPLHSQWWGVEQGRGCLTQATISVGTSGRRLNGPARRGRLQIGHPSMASPLLAGER